MRLQTWVCAKPCSVPEWPSRRSQWLLTQVELGAVALRYWTLVHISRLLVAIGFQWSTHNQPVQKEERSQVVGGHSFLKGWPWWWLGRRNGVEDFPDEGSWALSTKLGSLVPGLGIQR